MSHEIKYREAMHVYAVSSLVSMISTFVAAFHITSDPSTSTFFLAIACVSAIPALLFGMLYIAIQYKL